MPSAAASSVKVLATPAVRRVAREWGVALSDVTGTGEGGRVLKEDVLRHVEGIRGKSNIIVLVFMVLFCPYNYYNSCNSGSSH